VDGNHRRVTNITTTTPGHRLRDLIHATDPEIAETIKHGPRRNCA